MGHFGSVLLDKERMKYEKTQTKEAWKAKVRAGTKPEGAERSGHQASKSQVSPGGRDRKAAVTCLLSVVLESAVLDTTIVIFKKISKLGTFIWK